MIDSYLKDFPCLCDTLDGRRIIAVDSLLKLDIPDETYLVDYADNVAILISVRSVEFSWLKLDMVMWRDKKVDLPPCV